MFFGNGAEGTLHIEHGPGGGTYTSHTVGVYGMIWDIIDFFTRV